MRKQTILNALLALLALGLTVVVIQAAPGTQASLNSPLPTPGRFDSPLPTPIPCPSSVKWATLTIEMKVDGLRKRDSARLRLSPATPTTAACLSARGTKLPELSVRNEGRRITITDIPEGSYRLVIDAPAAYFRDPKGYLFQVSEGQIIRSGHSFHFRLVSPSDQDLPPCRNRRKPATRPDTSSHRPAARDISFEPQVVCRAERLVDVSSPPKRPEPQEKGVLDAGYHYVGPRTTQDNEGVWGRNYVVDPGVDHPGTAHRHVVERVYANDSSGDNWMEAGWAEVWWLDDDQYIYEFDSAANDWNFFDEYQLSPGSAVETLVEYRPDTDTWWALYYLGDNDWAILAEESLGFTTADRGYNRGEVYTADGTHPILPVSGFDKGYLRIDDVWRVWDTRYSTRVDEDAPYECDMIDQYYRFNVHSPVVFLPLVVKNW